MKLRKKKRYKRPKPYEWDPWDVPPNPGPFNQCNHPFMEWKDYGHWYCPDCDLEWNDAAEG